MDISMPKEVEEDLNLWKKMTIIGIFIGERVSREKMRKWVENNWHKLVIIKFIPNNFFHCYFVERGA